MQTRKCHTDANADTNRVRTKNNMSPSPSVGDIIRLVPFLYTSHKKLCFSTLSSKVYKNAAEAKRTSYYLQAFSFPTFSLSFPYPSSVMPDFPSAGDFQDLWEMVCMSAKHRPQKELLVIQ